MYSTHRNSEVDLQNHLCRDSLGNGVLSLRFELSPQRLTLYWRQQHVFWRNLHTQNQTLVNSIRLQPEAAQVLPSHVLQCGKYLVKWTNMFNSVFHLV